MPKPVRLLLRMVSTGAFVALVVYQVQALLAGQDLPGFRFVSLILFAGVLGVWQLTATPQEMEGATSFVEVHYRNNMVFMYVTAALALGYALYAVVQGSRDNAALGLAVVFLGLSSGSISALFLGRARKRVQASSSPRPHA